MSMYTALSGLNAAQSDIAVVSNNIANVGTTAFYKSRNEFADVFKSTPYSAPKRQIGIGVSLQDTRQVFSQGGLKQTENTFDLALEGQGFFAIRREQDQGVVRFTRAGDFSLNPDGFVANTAGSFLMTYPVAEDGAPLSTSLDMVRPVQVPPYRGQATATASIDAAINFSAGEAGLGGQVTVPPRDMFDPANPSTYANSTPITVLDDNGNRQDAALYFVKTAQPDADDPTTSYQAYLVVEGEVAFLSTPGTNTVTFDAFGTPTSAFADMQFQVGGRDISVNLDGSKLHSGAFAVAGYAHDGSVQGGLTGISIDKTGTIWASYAGQDAVALGKVAVANFVNPNGLRQNGDQTYDYAAEAGQVISGIAGQNGLGLVRAGTLENANVDLTEELVNLITAQRNYQASAKALETSAAVTQTIMNIRS